MKKFLFALLALPLLGIMTACSDSDKPDVDINISYGPDNSVVDGKVYVVAGNDIFIESVKAVAKDQSKKAALGPVTYYLIANDGNNHSVPLLIGTTAFEPFALKIPTTAGETSAQADTPDTPDTPGDAESNGYLLSNIHLPVGTYVIQMVMPVYEVDCEMATGYMSIEVEVMPAGSTLPTPTAPAPASPSYK